MKHFFCIFFQQLFTKLSDSCPQKMVEKSKVETGEHPRLGKVLTLTVYRHSTGQAAPR